MKARFQKRPVAGRPQNVEAKVFTQLELMKMAMAVRDGEADEGDARTLLMLFCESVEHAAISANDPVSACLLEHVRGSFRAYLEGKRVGNHGRVEIAGGEFGIREIKTTNVAAALGLVRKRGNPTKAAGPTQIAIATEVLRHRLDGMSHQEALATVEMSFGWGLTTISDAWRAHKQDALLKIRYARSASCDGDFTEQQKARLREIFGSEEWLLASGKSMISPE